MKTSRRCFLKATATGMGSVALAEFGAVAAGATQSDQIKKWDYEAGVVVLGIGAAGLRWPDSTAATWTTRRAFPAAEKTWRQAVLAKVVIDATGDGDLLPYSGADFKSDIDPTSGIAGTA